MIDINKEYKILDNISLSFNEIEVFKDFSLSIEKNKITCIVGPSGCGKTTILNLIAGFLDCPVGEVNGNKADIGYIFQEERLLPWETVYKNIALVREKSAEVEIDSILKELGLYEFRDKYPSQLSGGMKQRCALARGFYFNPKILLMDEPYKSLDYDLKINLIKYLRLLWDRNKNTVLFVTHDIDEALLLGHKTIVLSKRPTDIVNEFKLSTALSERSINNQEHIEIRKEIINYLTDMK